jgi:hypothetical protein
MDYVLSVRQTIGVEVDPTVTHDLLPRVAHGPVGRKRAGARVESEGLALGASSYLDVHVAMAHVEYRIVNMTPVYEARGRRTRRVVDHRDEGYPTHR